MQLIRRGERAVARRPQDSIQIQTPQQQRRRRLSWLLFIMMWLLIGISLTVSAIQKGSTTQTTDVQPKPPVVMTPAVSDYVLNQDERLRLENEKAEIQIQIDQLNEQINQANLARQQQLINRRTELEIERDDINNDILRWDAERDKLEKDWAVQNRARAEAVNIEATAAAYRVDVDNAQAAAEREQLQAQITMIGTALFLLGFGLLAIIVCVSVGLWIYGQVYRYWRVTKAKAEAEAKQAQLRPPQHSPVRETKKTVAQTYAEHMNPAAPPPYLS